MIKVRGEKKIFKIFFVTSAQINRETYSKSKELATDICKVYNLNIKITKKRS